MIENSQGNCLQCETGYIVSTDSLECIPDPKIDNC